jgi:predicted MFS family arabinose efflux permease
MVPSHFLTKYPLNVYQNLSKVEWDHDAPPTPLAARKNIDIFGPFRILINRSTTPIIIFLAIYYAVWQMSITAMSSLFESRYGLSEMQIGLTFIANGVGSMIGTLVTGKVLDLDYRRVRAKYEAQYNIEAGDKGKSVLSQAEFPIEKARLRLVPLFSGLQCLSILLFGWTNQYPRHVPIAVPIVSTFITGWTAVSTQSVIMTYLVDIFPDRSAAASASMNLARCLFAAGGTSFVMPMINGIGVGLTFTVCVAIQVIALAGLIVQWKFASLWRREAEEKRAHPSEA